MGGQGWGSGFGGKKGVGGVWGVRGRCVLLARWSQATPTRLMSSCFNNLSVSLSSLHSSLSLCVFLPSAASVCPFRISQFLPIVSYVPIRFRLSLIPCFVLDHSLSLSPLFRLARRGSKDISTPDIWLRLLSLPTPTSSPSHSLSSSASSHPLLLFSPAPAFHSPSPSLFPWFPFPSLLTSFCGCERRVTMADRPAYLKILSRYKVSFYSYFFLCFDEAETPLSGFFCFFSEIDEAGQPLSVILFVCFFL